MRVGIVTLGCDKNTVDNEYLAGLLADAGCEAVAIDPAAPPDGLDAAVVTTCGFIDSAKSQSVQAIVELAEAKKATGNPRRLFVAGCLSQRDGEALAREIPEIDGLVGVGQWARLAESILAADARAKQWLELNPTPTVNIYKLTRRQALDAAPHAFLKISDGCDHACAFCSIPLMKGRLRSVAPEILLEEARGLVARGAKEIDLVAQDLSMYGMDRELATGSHPGRPGYRLPDLLRELAALPGDFWIRCLYFYPGLVTDAFIDVLADEPKIVKYLDMPLQHLDPGVLRRMKRPFHDVGTEGLVARLREHVPGIVLRTTMIVGFPGETEAEHQAMLDGIARLRFERLGAFPYSEEEGTPTAKAKDQVPKRARKARWHAVMRAQQAVASAYSRRRVGQRERVLVEGFDPERGLWIARSAAEAPEIDGKILIHPGKNAKIENVIKPGQFLDVEITKAAVYDCHARPAPASPSESPCFLC
jgi:ribosomal protein S12 methylthiotransferase